MHPTAYCYTGDADPQAPEGMAAIYRDLANDDDRARQITADVTAALARGRHCLVLTLWIAHLEKLADELRGIGHDPIVLRGGMGTKCRSAALARLQPPPGSPPLLVVATGPYAEEGFGCPILDTLFRGPGRQRDDRRAGRPRAVRPRCAQEVGSGRGGQRHAPGSGG
jgi:hypothetical protein